MSSTLELDPQRTAILVLDVQPVIMSMVTGSEQCLPNILRVIDAGQKASCLTVYVRVAFEHQEWAAIGPNTKNFHNMKQSSGQFDTAPDFIHVDSQSAALHPDVAARVIKGRSVLIRKNRFGPFVRTALNEELEKNHIDTLVIVGFKTSGAVLSTIRAAADHDCKIVVTQDAVTDADQQRHQILLERNFPEQGHVVNTSDVETALA